MADELVAESFAGLRIGDALIKQSHRHTGHLRRHPKSLIIEIIHNGVKAFILIAH